MNRSPALPIACGLAAGALGSWWILEDYVHKAYALGYHVPLAIAFTAAFVDEVLNAFRTRRVGFLWASALAGAVIVGRMIRDWPLSGHGILGALMAVAPLRLPLRIAGAAIAVQAGITKAVLHEGWMSVVWGALLGIGLGFLARRLDRLRSARDGTASRA